MTGNRVLGKILIFGIVLTGCFIAAGFGLNDFRQSEQSTLSFYENLLLSGEEAFISGEYEKAIKELEIAAFGLFQSKHLVAKAYILMGLSYHHLENPNNAEGFLKKAGQLLNQDELIVLELNIDESDSKILEKLIQDYNVYLVETDPPLSEEESPPPELPLPPKIEPEKKIQQEAVEEKPPPVIEQEITQPEKKILPETAQKIPPPVNKQEKTQPPEQSKTISEEKSQEKEIQIEGLEKLFLPDEAVEEPIVSEIWIHKETNAIEIGILFQSNSRHQVFEITDIPPNRIVIDIYDIRRIKASGSIDIHDYGITLIRSGMYKDTIARVVIDAEGDLPSYKLEKSEDGLRVVIEK